VGGKGINVSLVLKNLDVQSKVMGFIAGFTGKEIEKQLREKDIETDFIELAEGDSRINVKLQSKDETEINAQGPVITPADIEKLYEKMEVITADDVLILAGSIPKGLSEDTYIDIMRYMEEKGCTVVVDASGEQLRDVLPYHPFLVKPNLYELSELFEKEITDRKDVMEYAIKVQEMGARNVLVSMGPEGAIFIADDGYVYDEKPPQGKIVNTVGAGDSMVAGFIAEYIESKSYEKALIMGLCAGSASAFSHDFATKTEIMKLLDEY
jgi:1-phosphofructokinase